MKKLFILLLLPLFSYGQYTKTVNQTKVLVEKRDVYLNGGLRASAGGKSRVLVPVELPSNTVEWYYSFSTSKGESGTKNLKLAAQLATLVADPTGITASISSKINVPQGSSSADIYLLDSRNHIAFEQKYDNNGGTFKYWPEGTTLNTKQAIVRIDDVKVGKYYLGLKNPSTLDGINISIEVVAIVENEVYVDEWTTQSKENLRNYCMKTFLTSEPGRHDVCECAIEKVVIDKKPSDWSKLSKSSKQSFIKNEKNNCFEGTGNLALLDAENKKAAILEQQRKRSKAIVDSITDHYKAAFASSKMGDYKSAIDEMKTSLQIAERNPEANLKYSDTWVGSCYNSMAWWSLLENDLNGAGEYLKKALAFDSQNMYLRGNLGIYHVLNNNYNLAEEAFTYYKRRAKLPNGERWFEVIGNDLETLENRGITHPDFEKVRELLRI